MRFLLLFVILQMSNLAQFAQTQYEGVFAGAQYGVCITDEDGGAILSVNASRKFNPASTMKTVTTGTALLSLGADYRWETTLCYSGKISGGVLDGDLHIIGGGDPMLCSPDNKETPRDSLYANWLRILQATGISRIKGEIIGDGSWTEGMREVESWSYDDIGTYYGTCASGLTFYENMKTFSVSTAGLKEGDAPVISDSFPQTPWLKWQSDCTVGPEGSGDSLYMFGADFSDAPVIRGTYATGRQGRLRCRNNNPELSLAYDFMTYLQEHGISAGGYSAVKDSKDSRSARNMSGRLSILGTTESVNLETVMTRTNRDSNNLFAEMLLRTMGFENGNGSSTAGGLGAQKEVLENQLGMRTDNDYIAVDGSGLSRKDLLTPAWMCDFLCSMKRVGSERGVFDKYLNSLVPYSSRCRLKTGSFGGCRCLCGYILPSSPSGRTICFAIMVNSSEMKMSQIDKEEKRFLDVIAALN